MVGESQHHRVRIRLLGGFGVNVDGVEIGVSAWPGRRAADLVQLLALADDHRLLRDQVVEALWPHLDADAGAANLRKAAHHARRALGSGDAVTMRSGEVALFPGSVVETDVAAFAADATEALAAGDGPACARAAARYPGDLLPAALYEEWTQAPRERLRRRFLDLLRGSGQWARVVELEPADEPAHRELMQAALAAGNRHAAIRWYGRLRTALAREVGVAPASETEALYDQCIAGLGPPEPSFVGRELDLAHVTTVLRSERASGVYAVAVRGPAGIGKSAFVGAVSALAAARGWMAITVRATEAARPYAPIADVIDQLVARDRSLLDVVGDRARSVLAELSELAGPAAARTGPVTRHQVIGAVRRLLLAASDTAGVVLIVDDAHTADDATIGALAHLLGGTGPVIAVLAYRPDEAPPPLVGTVERLHRTGRAVILDLGPMEREHVAALVAASAPTDPPAKVVDRIVHLAEGNPFFAVELARGVEPSGQLVLGPTIWEAITARFVGLGEATVARLRRLALATDELDPATVVALTGSSEDEAFALLDAALAAGALVVVGARYHFRHDLLRRALVEQLPPHQRIAVHRDAARRLATAGVAPALVARHWLAGNRPDEARPWLLAAARHAMKVAAYSDAIAHLDRLLDHIPDDADALCLRADALDALGDPRALAAYASAADVVGEPGSHDIRAKLALAQVKQGDPPGGLRVLEGVRPTTTAGKLARALAVSGAAALGFGDPAAAALEAANGRRLAFASGDPEAVIVASWAQAAAAHARGELRSSVETDLRETHTLPTLAVNVFDGQLCITQRLLYGARPYPDVISFADGLAAEAERLGAARGLAFAVTLRGEARLLSGDLAGAEDDLQRGRELHRVLGAPTGEAFALQRHAEAAFHAGRRHDAALLLDEALAVARESDVGFHLLDRIYGARVAFAPDPATARRELDDAEDAVSGPVETCPGCRITFAVPAAIAAARAGDVDRAEAHAEGVEWLANVVMRLPAWYAAHDEVRGHLALARGDVADAVEHFAAAADGFRRAGQPLDAARCAALP